MSDQIRGPLEQPLAFPAGICTYIVKLFEFSIQFLISAFAANA